MTKSAPTKIPSDALFVPTLSLSEIWDAIWLTVCHHLLTRPRVWLNQTKSQPLNSVNLSCQRQTLHSVEPAQWGSPIILHLWILSILTRLARLWVLSWKVLGWKLLVDWRHFSLCISFFSETFWHILTQWQNWRATVQICCWTDFGDWMGSQVSWMGVA